MTKNTDSAKVFLDVFENILNKCAKFYNILLEVYFRDTPVVALA